MVSVPSDPTASTSFQVAPPRPSRPDPSPAADSFGALVDSNTNTANNARAQDPAPAPQAAPPDKRPARDATADKPARDNSDDRNSAPAANPTSADKATSADSSRSATSKSAPTKNDESKPAKKPSSDDDAATDSTDTKAASDKTAADAIAAAMQVVVIPADAQATTAPGATPTDDASLAITGSSAVAQAAAVPAAPVNVAAAKAAAAGAKTDAQGTTDEKIADGQAGLATERTAATDAALTAAALPAAPKSATAPKPSSAARSDATASPGDPDAQAISAADRQAGNADTPAISPDTAEPATAKLNNGSFAETAKAELTGAHAPSAGGTAHANQAGLDAAPGQTNVQGNAVQAGPLFQPHWQVTATQSQPSLNVTAATQATAVPLSGLAMEIAASANSGKSRFEIRLDPADLGRIDVRIDVDRNGHVTSHLTVEKPETLSMLRQDAPQLQRALNDAGLSTGNGGLQFSLRDQSSSGQNGNQSNPNAQHLIITDDEAVPAAVASQYGRMLGASGGVDIRV